MRAALAARRELCFQRLDNMGGSFDYVRPQGAFYIMARYQFTDEPSRDVALNILNEARVVTVPGAPLDREEKAICASRLAGMKKNFRKRSIELSTG